MGTPSAALFPDNIAAVVGNLSSPGNNTTSIFEFRESVLRALGAYGVYTVHRQATQPATPAAWDFWIIPGTLSGASINSADVKVYDGSAWQNVTPALFAKAVVHKVLPTNAAGYLYNDGSGNFAYSNPNPLPTDAAGVLKNDGSGNLSWASDAYDPVAAFTVLMNNSASSGTPTGVNPASVVANTAPATTRILWTFDPTTGQVAKSTIAELRAQLSIPAAGITAANIAGTGVGGILVMEISDTVIHWSAARGTTYSAATLNASGAGVPAGSTWTLLGVGFHDSGAGWVGATLVRTA